MKQWLNVKDDVEGKEGNKRYTLSKVPSSGLVHSWCSCCRACILYAGTKVHRIRLKGLDDMHYVWLQPLAQLVPTAVSAVWPGHCALSQPGQ